MLLFIDRYERNIAEIKETFKIQLNDLEYENRKLRHGNKQKELTMGRFKQRFSEAYMAATERVENKINILQTTRIKTVIILSLIYFFHSKERILSSWMLQSYSYSPFYLGNVEE